MIFRLSHDIEVNFTAITRDLDGNIIQQVQEHNVVINVGRKYLRDALCCPDYGQLSSSPPVQLPEPPAARITDHKVKYVAVGTGGVLQSQTYPGQGAYSEIVTVGGLERPVAVSYNAAGFHGVGTGTELQWLKQVEPQDGVEELPDDFSAIFRAVFGIDEISMPGQIGSYGTIVPISEFLLLTSEAEAYVTAPTPVEFYRVLLSDGVTYYTFPDKTTSFAGCNGDVPGALAYNVSTPIIKTSAMTLEVLWELRS